MTTTDRVLNVRDLSGPLPDDVVYVGRGGYHHGKRLRKSPWGNPFPVTSLGRTGAVNQFRRYAEAFLKMVPSWLDPLIGKRIACHCKPLECHADALMEMVMKIEAER